MGREPASFSGRPMGGLNYSMDGLTQKSAQRTVSYMLFDIILK
jgi:hypothetical protein